MENEASNTPSPLDPPPSSWPPLQSQPASHQRRNPTLLSLPLSYFTAPGVTSSNLEESLLLEGSWFLHWDYSSTQNSISAGPHCGPTPTFLFQPKQHLEEGRGNHISQDCCLSGLALVVLAPKSGVNRRLFRWDESPRPVVSGGITSPSSTQRACLGPMSQTAAMDKRWGVPLFSSAVR